MLIGVLLLLGLVSVPLLGGQLSRLTQVHLRLMPVVVGAFAVQILIVNVLPAGDHDLHAAVHIATYAVLGGALLANLRTPGMPLIALGGLCNALAIVANGGVMPASEGALRFAGMTADPEGFTNSGLVHDAHLAFLGDVFAVPAWVPAANVFSVGDLLLVVGGWVLMHRVCGTHAPWRRVLDRGPGVVLFGAGGAVEAATPQAVRMLDALDHGAVRSALGIALPPEAYIVAGRARAGARGQAVAAAEARVIDRRGRVLTFTASCLDAADAAGPRVAVVCDRA